MDYICPMCSSEKPLNRRGDSFLCEACGAKYEVKDNIPIFSINKNYYFNPIPREIMHLCLQITNLQGWEKGLREILSHIPLKSRKQWLDNLVSEKRAGWLPLLDIPCHGTALNLGCGWDSISLSLARYCESVVCCDLTYERLQFLKEKAEQQGFQNLIYVCGGDTPRLPFPSEFFNIVVLNGVLEWVAVTREGNPKKIQIDFLREINRILRESGQLYIAIENRFSYEYFLGKPDNHSYLLFSSLLPRILANYYSLIKKGEQYRTYTYTIIGYKKLFKKSGYSNTRFYSLIPSYHQFNQVVDLSSSNQMHCEISQCPRKLKKWLFKSRFYKYFASCFGIIASKGNNSSFIFDLVQYVSQSLGVKGLNIRHYAVSEKETVIIRVRNSNTKAIIRVPISDRAYKYTKTHFDTIKSIHENERIPNRLKKYVPFPMCEGEYKGIPYFVEEEIQGIKGSELSSALVRKAVEESARFIIDFHLNTYDSQIFSEDKLEKLVSEYISSALSMVEDSWSKKILEKIRVYLISNFIGKKLPLVWVKGDFTFSNLIFDEENRLAGVIDWDSSIEGGPPLQDLLSLFGSSRRTFEGESLGEVLVNVLFPKKLEEYEKNILDEYCNNIGLPEELFIPLCILYWLYDIRSQIDYYIKFNDIWMKQNFLRVLHYLDEILD